jgi:hypothetical protein
MAVSENARIPEQFCVFCMGRNHPKMSISGWRLLIGYHISGVFVGMMNNQSCFKVQPKWLTF